MINTLQIGEVKQIQPDAENAFQVLVTIPSLEYKEVWVRLANMYATSGIGTCFYPEIGDEVVLGFLNSDINFPIILGSLYSNSSSPAYTPDEGNKTKAIVSKSKIRIVMDDESKSITITTPGDNKIILSDDAKSISLSDQNGNYIEMNSSGITIQSISDITLKASKNINVTATADMTLSGLSIKGAAETQMTMTGTASAEFSASGEVTVKGAMVMIN